MTQKKVSPSSTRPEAKSKKTPANRLKHLVNSVGLWMVRQLRRRPLTSLTVSLCLLLGLIILGSKLRIQGQEVVSSSAQPAQVTVWQVGQAPEVEVLATVTKENVIQIVAQTSGIVQKIQVKEGDQVKRNQNLAFISTNYQGASAFGLQRQLAAKQLENATTTQPLQKELLAKQRQIAEKSFTNSDELRQISEDSVDETEDLLSLNQDIVNYLDDSINELSASAAAKIENRDEIYQIKQLKSSYQSAVNQLQSSLRQLNYQTDTDNPPQQLAELQRDLTLKQLEIQEKSLDLNVEISQLQLRLAQVNESLAWPVTPLAGVVQRVHVQRGQLVSPGTVLVTIAADQGATTLTALVDQSLASQLSRYQPVSLKIGSNNLSLYPDFISTEATSQGMHSIKLTLPVEYQDQVTTDQRIALSLPLGLPDTNQTVPYVPIDAVYQTKGQAVVYVVESGQAVAKPVTLGEVYGQFVTILDGLTGQQQIILQRGIVAGQAVVIDSKQ